MASVNLENKSARILIIGLGGGASLTVPPTDPTTGVGAITVKFANDDDKARFDRAVATPAVQEWIDAEELVISDGPADPEPETKAPPPSAAESEPDTRPKRAEAQPERKHKHFFGSDKEKGEP